jgi:plastocyanin
MNTVLLTRRPRVRRWVALGAAGLALALVGAGCAGDDDGGGASGEAVDIADSEFTDEVDSDEVDISSPDNAFEPGYVKIKPGTAVTWSNDGRNDHNVTPVVEGSFDGVPTDEFKPGQVYSTTFDEPGDYAYYCTIHGTKNLGGQSGVVRVVPPPPDKP